MKYTTTDGKTYIFVDDCPCHKTTAGHPITPYSTNKMKKQKTIEERIGEIFDEAMPYRTINWDMFPPRIEAIKELKSLISDVIREIVGKDIAKQEIRQKAKNLGIKI